MWYFWKLSLASCLLCIATQMLPFILTVNFRNCQKNVLRCKQSHNLFFCCCNQIEKGFSVYFGLSLYGVYFLSFLPTIRALSMICYRLFAWTSVLQNLQIIVLQANVMPLLQKAEETATRKICHKFFPLIFNVSVVCYWKMPTSEKLMWIGGNTSFLYLFPSNNSTATKKGIDVLKRHRLHIQKNY